MLRQLFNSGSVSANRWVRSGLATVTIAATLAAGAAHAAQPAALTTPALPYVRAMTWHMFVTNLNLASATGDGSCNVVLRVKDEGGLTLANINATVPAGGRTDPFEGVLPDPGKVTSVRFEYAVPRDANAKKFCSLQSVLMSAFTVDSNGLERNAAARDSIFVPGRTYSFTLGATGE
jgi:hypothetical protein